MTLTLSSCACRLTILEEDLARMSPDMGAIEAYRQKEADYNSRVDQLEAATAERDGVSHGSFSKPVICLLYNG